MIPQWLESPGCKCKDYAAKMDAWGADGCEDRFGEIVDHLVSQAEIHPMTRLASRWARPAAEYALRRAIRQAKAGIRGG